MKPKSHDFSSRCPMHFRPPLILAGSLAMMAASGISRATDCTWNVASGNWNIAGSWTPSVPVSGGTDSVFFSSAAVGDSAVTVTLDGNKVVSAVTFQSSSTTLLTAGASNRNLTMSAGMTVLSGAGAVTLSTASNASNGLQISADQTWTNDGTLTITSIVRPTVATESRTLTLTGSGTTHITDAGRFRDILTLIKDGAGTLTLGGTPSNYTYTGELTVKAGILAIPAINNPTSNGMLGKGILPVTLGDTGAVTGTLSFTGTNGSSNRAFTMAAGGTGAFEVVEAAATLTLSGVIDGSGRLKKTGAGTLVLSGSSNSHGGGTEIAGGNLRVNGNTGAVSISATGTLEGNGGTVGGAVSMVSGSTVAPGTASTIGTLNTAGNVDFVPGALFDADINTDGSTSDQLIVNGDLNLAGATLATQNLGAGAPASFELFTIAICTGTLTGTFNGLAEGAIVPIGGRNYTLSYAGGIISLMAPEVIGTPFDAWAAENITAINPAADATPQGDPDKDGTSNLAEFAFDGDPLDGADNGRIYLLTADSDFDTPDTAKELILTVAVLEGAPDFINSPSPSSTVEQITYTIEGGNTLGSFDTVVHVVPTPVTTDLPAAGTGYEYRSFSLEGSNGLSGRGFLRAKVNN